jgi:c-di-GMP-binding flagellar brake protein YcgR
VNVPTPVSGDTIFVVAGTEKLRAAVVQCGSQTLSIEVDPGIRLTGGAMVAVEWSEASGLARATYEVVMQRRFRLVLKQVGPSLLIQRRETPRIELDLGIEVSTYRGRASGRTVDVSEGGVLANVPSLRAHVGEQVELQVAIPERAINASALVVRSDGDGLVAFRFTEMGVSARERLVRLLSSVQAAEASASQAAMSAAGAA